MTQEIKPTMLLITSAMKGQKTFKLMPVSNDCPFNEVLYMPSGNILVIISKNKKQSVHMLPKLDANGDAELVETSTILNAKAPGLEDPKVKQERVQIETYTEHYIAEKEEIENFIEMFAVNASSYDYKKHMVQLDTPIVKLDNKIHLVKK